MDTIAFTWEPEKEKANQDKHGISFDEAQTVFLDENAQLIADPDHSMEEDRFILHGLSTSLKLLVVCHCYRENEQLIRIISARKASRHEQRTYTKGY